MTGEDGRRSLRPDRRRVSRGGRREYDRPGRDPMLLVADSYGEVRRVYVRYLNLFGFLVKEAQNASETIDALLASAPRVILADPRMLMLSAARSWEQARTEQRTRSTPIIFLVTDFDVPEEVMNRFRPAAVLHKPFHLTSLTAAVRRVLRTQAPVVS
jgi:DNA-binding response OmpR family regulator